MAIRVSTAEQETWRLIRQPLATRRVKYGSEEKLTFQWRLTVGQESPYLTATGSCECYYHTTFVLATSGNLGRWLHKKCPMPKIWPRRDARHLLGQAQAKHPACEGKDLRRPSGAFLELRELPPASPSRPGHGSHDSPPGQAAAEGVPLASARSSEFGYSHEIRPEREAVRATPPAHVLELPIDSTNIPAAIEPSFGYSRVAAKWKLGLIYLCELVVISC